MTSKAKKQPSRNSVKKKAPEPVTETVIEGEAVVMPDEPAPDQPRKDTSFSDRGNKANSGEDTARPGSAPETATPSRPPALVLAALVIGLIAAVGPLALHRTRGFLRTSLYSYIDFDLLLLCHCFFALSVSNRHDLYSILTELNGSLPTL